MTKLHLFYIILHNMDADVAFIQTQSFVSYMQQNSIVHISPYATAFFHYCAYQAEENPLLTKMELCSHLSESETGVNSDSFARTHF